MELKTFPEKLFNYLVSNVGKLITAIQKSLSGGINFTNQVWQTSAETTKGWWKSAKNVTGGIVKSAKNAIESVIQGQGAGGIGSLSNIFDTTSDADSTKKNQKTSTATPAGFGQKVAQAGVSAARSMGTVGFCLTGVTRALKKVGINLTGIESACDSTPVLDKAPQFMKTKVSGRALTKLPAGSIVVWDRKYAKTPANRRSGLHGGQIHGHISIADGKGNEMSDHISKQLTKTWYGATVPKAVYIPKDSASGFTPTGVTSTFSKVNDIPVIGGLTASAGNVMSGSINQTFGNFANNKAISSIGSSIGSVSQPIRDFTSNISNSIGDTMGALGNSMETMGFSNQAPIQFNDVLMGAIKKSMEKDLPQKQSYESRIMANNFYPKVYNKKSGNSIIVNDFAINDSNLDYITNALHA